MILKYIPNTLSAVRLALIIPFLTFLSQSEYKHAFYIFILAGFTDGLDGWLARYFHWQSFFGSLIDPLADKLLIASSFISLAMIGILPWWLVILVFLRDLTISLGAMAWYCWIQREVHFRPSNLSKLNTFFQLTLLTLCLFELSFFRFSPYIVQGFILITTLTTTTTFLDYVLTWGKRAWTIQHPSQ